MILLFLLLVSGCSFSQDTNEDAGKKGDENSKAEEEQASDEQNLVEGEEVDSDKEKELPDVPENFEDAVDYPLTGEFAGEDYEENREEIEKRLDEIPEVTDPYGDEGAEAINKTYSLFAEGFSMPNIPINQWDNMTIGDPEDEDDDNEAELKVKYHVAILLDSSGSMANYENEKTRMELAKESINEFVSELPEQAQVTLQVYGHEGSGSEADKEMSCESVETLYSLDKYEGEEFQDALNKFEPAGWTPLAKAIEEVTDDFDEFDGEDSTNIIYVVSDGEETCGGDPVQAVEDLADSNIDPVINLIGYQANNEGMDQLKEMAETADGNFINATSQDQLNKEFENTKDMSEVWSDWHGETQGEIKDLRATLSDQMDDWHDTMKERHKRQKDNLSHALEYLEDERAFDLGPDSGLEFRQARLGISNGIRSNYLQLDNDNRTEFLQKSNDARMKYLEERN